MNFCVNCSKDVPKKYEESHRRYHARRRAKRSKQLRKRSAAAAENLRLSRARRKQKRVAN